MNGLIDCRTKKASRSWTGSPLEMIEVFDRPLLQHAVEQMVQSGVTHCALITEDPRGVIARWGEGERWGCTFSAIQPHQITLYLAQLGARAPVMVGRGDTVPSIAEVLDLAEFQEEFWEGPTRLVFCAREDSEPTYSGWAVTDARTLLQRCFATQGADGLLQALDDAKSGTAVVAPHGLSSESPQSFLKSLALVLEQEVPTVIFHGIEVRPGIWTGHDSYIHPTAKLKGRVFLGDNVRVCSNAVIEGPAVICRDAVIDVGARVLRSNVQPGTYVGRGVELREEIGLAGSQAQLAEERRIRLESSERSSRAPMSLWSYARMLWRSMRRTPAIE